MITTNLSIDEKKLLATLSKEGLIKQTNFAIAKTLTQVAWDAKSKVTAMLFRHLKIKRQFLPRSVVVVKATPNNQEAIIGFLERAKLVELLEEGGRRRPVGSRYIAIPHGAKTARGTVPKSKRPTQLLALPNTFVSTINGQKGIWQVQNKGGRRRVVFMYDFEPEVTYERNTIRFHETVNKTAKYSFKNRFKRNFIDAVRTAKR
jgi:hypothetical protein